MARQQRLDLPLCGRAGCENRVKDARNFYCSYACISPEERKAWSRDGQAKQAYLRRARRFKKLVDELGQRPKRCDILQALQGAYWMGMFAEASAVWRRKQGNRVGDNSTMSHAIDRNHA